MVSMMAGMATILKVFNCYLLLNGKSDGAETWWKASGQCADLELLKWFRSDIQDAPMAAILAILKPDYLQIIHVSAPDW